MPFRHPDRSHGLSTRIEHEVRERLEEAVDYVCLEALVRTRHALADAAAQHLASYLLERTEGNPLFLTELLRTLEADGLLDRLDERSYAEPASTTASSSETSS